MSNEIQGTIDKLSLLFLKTDEALNEWQGETNLQFPILLSMIAVKLNWNSKKLREVDPIIRYYVRNHPDWYVTRGAHGGIMRKADKQKKEDAKLAKEKAKIEMKALIEAEAAKTLAVTSKEDENISE